MKKKIILIIILIIIVVAIIVGINIFGKKDSPIKNIFNKETYSEYKSGDTITFKDQEWYVLYDSDKNSDYVTLISADILYLGDEGIEKVFNEVYEISSLNKYLTSTYLDNLGSDNFIEIHGYKVRLLNIDDINNLTKYTYDEENDEYIINECPEFLCLPNASFATMIDTKNKEFVDTYTNVDDIEDPVSEDYILHLKYYNLQSTYETSKLQSLVNDTSLLVRPIVNVYKKSLS